MSNREELMRDVEASESLVSASDLIFSERVLLRRVLAFARAVLSPPEDVAKAMGRIEVGDESDDDGLVVARWIIGLTGDAT